MKQLQIGGHTLQIGGGGGGTHIFFFFFFFNFFFLGGGHICANYWGAPCPPPPPIPTALSSGSFLRVPPVALKMQPHTMLGFSNELSTCFTIFKLVNILSRTQQYGILLVTCVRSFMYSSLLAL